MTETTKAAREAVAAHLQTLGLGPGSLIFYEAKRWALTGVMSTKLSAERREEMLALALAFDAFAAAGLEREKQLREVIGWCADLQNSVIKALGDDKALAGLRDRLRAYAEGRLP